MSENYQSEYYQKNRDAILAKTTEYYKNNRESIIAKNKKYYQKNREIVRAKNRKRKEFSTIKIGTLRISTNEKKEVKIQRKKHKLIIKIIIGTLLLLEIKNCLVTIGKGVGRLTTVVKKLRNIKL